MIWKQDILIEMDTTPERHTRKAETGRKSATDTTLMHTEREEHER